MSADDLSKSESFCIMPFICMHNMSNGLMKMCCITENPIVDDFGKNFYIGNQPVEEVWNSNFMKSARKKMLSGEKINPCKNCYNVEQSGATSLRQSYNDQYFESFRNHVEESIEKNGKITNFPAFIELRTGNTCNSACRMCNTNDSSLIYKENTHIHNTLKDKIQDPEVVSRGYITLGDPEYVIFGSSNDRMSTRVMNLDAHFNEVIENIKDIKFLTLSGGEPFLLEKTYSLLQEIVEKNPNITLYVNTNGSILTDKLVDLLKKIKEVRICVSIDGYESVQEYIRHPLKWKKINKNLNKLNTLRNKNFFLNFNITVQSFNILNLEDIIMKLLVDYSGAYVNLSILTSPDHFCIQNIPDEAKDLVKERNKNIIEKIKSIKNLRDYEKYNANSVINQLQDINSFMLAKPMDQELFKRLQANIKIYDLYRNQKIEDYIPDWKQFL